jgi:hypothetical protein
VHQPLPSRRSGRTLGPMTDPEDEPGVVDIAIPALDRCRAIAELLARLLLSS